MCFLKLVLLFCITLRHSTRIHIGFIIEKLIVKLVIQALCRCAFLYLVNHVSRLCEYRKSQRSICERSLHLAYRIMSRGMFVSVVPTVCRASLWISRQDVFYEHFPKFQVRHKFMSKDEGRLKDRRFRRALHKQRSYTKSFVFFSTYFGHILTKVPSVPSVPAGRQST